MVIFIKKNYNSMVERSSVDFYKMHDIESVE